MEKHEIKRPSAEDFAGKTFDEVPLSYRNMLKASLANKGEAILVDGSNAEPLSEEEMRRYFFAEGIMAHLAVRAPFEHGSGHPGGALSSFAIAHFINMNMDPENDWPLLISPAHESVLAHGSQWLYGKDGDDPRYTGPHTIIKKFRSPGGLSGHAEAGDGDTPFGTGPLGKGPSYILGAAIGYKMAGKNGKFNVIVGDGEMQEGQVFEMMRIAAHRRIDNLIMHCDFNDIQLHDRPSNTMSCDIAAMAHSIGWHVIEVQNGNDAVQVSTAQKRAQALLGRGKPVFVCYYTVMGLGVKVMEDDSNEKSGKLVINHGAPLSKEKTANALKSLPDLDELIREYNPYRRELKEKYFLANTVRTDTVLGFDARALKSWGFRRAVTAEKGAARKDFGETHILDLMKADDRIIVLHADIGGSGGFGKVEKEFPANVINCGVAEANMYMMAAGLRQAGFLPVTYTFAPFAKNEGGANIRLIDMNLEHTHCGVLHDITHAGTSVGEDGPTHQELNYFNVPYPNTEVWMPADSNQAAAAAEKGLEKIARERKQVFVCFPRTGHEQLKRKDGSIFYGENYKFDGKADAIRGADTTDDVLTVIAAGIPLHEAVKAADKIKEEDNDTIRVLNAACVRPLDASAVLKAAIETGMIIVVEDHNIEGGLATQVSDLVATYGLPVRVRRVGVNGYMESAPAEYLMKEAGFDCESLVKAIREELIVPDGRTEHGWKLALKQIWYIQSDTRNRFAQSAESFIDILLSDYGEADRKDIQKAWANAESVAKSYLSD